MRRIFIPMLFLALCLCVSTAAQAVEATPDNYTLSVSRINESSFEKPEIVFVLSRANTSYPVIGVFKTSSALATYLSHLARGSKVENSGECTGPNLSQEDFTAVKSACEKASVAFIHHPAG